jgi:hypothetical protein
VRVEQSWAARPRTMMVAKREMVAPSRQVPPYALHAG